MEIIKFIIWATICAFIIFQTSITVQIIFLAIMIFFILGSFLIRKQGWAKPFFTSKLNFFTSKFSVKKEYNISNKLFFENIIKIIDSSNFNLAYSSLPNREILATTLFDGHSWGENLYINFRQEGEKTIMIFCSTTIFQMISWGKNKRNYQQLLRKIESSLTI